LAVEAEVARRLAALTAVAPKSNDIPVSAPTTVSEMPPIQESQPLRAPSPPLARPPSPARFDHGELQTPVDAEVVSHDDQGRDDAEPPLFFDDPPEAPDPVEDTPVSNLEDTHDSGLRMERETIAREKTPRFKEKSLPKRHFPEVSEPSREKPVTEGRKADAQGQDQEAKERYRRKLTKGLKQKHEKYRSECVLLFSMVTPTYFVFTDGMFLNSGQSVDRYKFARACIIAGKMALEEHDDVELAISMFEKAISWYPENERLLEESVLSFEPGDIQLSYPHLSSRTLKLKKRLRGGSEDGEGSGQRSLSSTKTPSKSTTTLKPLGSARNANTSDAKVQRRQFFQFDVEKEEVRNKQKPAKETGPKKKKEANSKPRGDDAQVISGKGKGKRKGKGRAVIEAAAAAFADSGVEEVEDPSQDSEAEVEKSLQAEYSDAVPSPSPVKTKTKRKRKAASSDDEEYHDLLGKAPKVSKELPPKRQRIIF
jgi:hypothetical protein